MACRAHGSCQIFSGLDIRALRYLRDGQKNGHSKHFFHRSSLDEIVDSVAAEGASELRLTLTVNESIPALKSDHLADRVVCPDRCRQCQVSRFKGANDRSQAWASQAGANEARTTKLAMHPRPGKVGFGARRRIPAGTTNGRCRIQKRSIAAGDSRRRLLGQARADRG